jgi:hypothetical protein
MEPEGSLLCSKEPSTDDVKYTLDKKWNNSMREYAIASNEA